jgi:hypothetical protein
MDLNPIAARSVCRLISGRFHVCCGSPGFLCLLLPGKPFPPLLANSLRVALSLLLLEKSFAQPTPLGVVLSQATTLDAAVVTHASLTDVAVLARHTREEPLQSQLDRCLSANDLPHLIAII